MTQEQIALIKQLRSEGRTLMAIAKEIGCSDSTVYKHLKPKAPKQSPPKKLGPSTPRILSRPPLQRFPSSVPITRPIVWTDRQKIQPTKSEMYAQLAAAVLNAGR